MLNGSVKSDRDAVKAIRALGRQVVGLTFYIDTNIWIYYAITGPPYFALRR